MLDSTNYPTIPQRTIDTIRFYVEEGLEPGGFVTAVLANNLTEAVFRADLDNYAALKDICRFVYWEVPASAWGNENKINAWMHKVRSSKTTISEE